MSQVTRQISKVINRAKAKISDDKPSVTVTPALQAANVRIGQREPEGPVE